jgi:hypothetical protein
MRRRFLSLLGVSASALAAVWLAEIPLTAQVPTTPAKATASAVTANPSSNWTPPRTPWGDPDLQGVYNTATGTPLQRPREAGEKTVYSDAEADAFEAEQEAEIDAPPRADYPTGNYNDHWFDPQRRKLTPDKRTSLIVDPADGRIPPAVPLSPERERARAVAADANLRFIDGFPNNWQETSPPLRCISRQDKPPVLPAGYNSNVQIFQSPGYVAIVVEMKGAARLVPLDGRPALGKNIRNWVGEPRGHFEGNTLVVESTNFRLEGVYGYAGGQYGTNRDALPPVVANPATYHLTERFTKISDDTVDYEFTVSDPQTWTRPWTARIPWTRMDVANPGHQLLEYACHEDNYDAIHMLSAARRREQAGEQPGPPGPALRKFFEGVDKN